MIYVVALILIIFRVAHYVQLAELSLHVCILAYSSADLYLFVSVNEHHYHCQGTNVFTNVHPFVCLFVCLLACYMFMNRIL